MTDQPPDPGFDPAAPVIPVARRSGRARAVIAVLAIIVAFAFVIRPLVITPPEPPAKSSAPTPEPASAAGDRIAVVAPDGTLSIVDRTGRLVRRLPAEATTFRFPAFSPDGGSLAAIGATANSSSVVVFDVRAGVGDGAAASPRTVFSNPDRGVIYLSWAPDSQRIGLLTGEPGTLALRVISADGGDAQVVIEGQPLYWDWLDGSSLLVHGGGSGAGAFIGEVSIDGAAPLERTSLSGIFQSPAVSADGRYLAFVAGGPGAASTLVIDEREGAARSALVDLRAASFGWNPVRPELAFIDGGGAAGPSLGPLRVGDAATGLTRTLLDAAVAAFFWSPDGTSIAALSIEPVDGGNIATATRPGERGLAAIPGFSVRLVVVDVSSGEHAFERIVALSELFEQQLLPFFDQYAKSHAIWSADSRAVVLPLVDAEGATHVLVIPVDGGPEVDLGPGVLGFWSP